MYLVMIHLIQALVAFMITNYLCYIDLDGNVIACFGIPVVRVVASNYNWQRILIWEDCMSYYLNTLCIIDTFFTAAYERII